MVSFLGGGGGGGGGGVNFYFLEPLFFWSHLMNTIMRFADVFWIANFAALRM